MKPLVYNEDDIQFVVEMTKHNKAKAEKLILQVYKDLEDDTLNIFDVLDIIEKECKAKEIKVYNQAEPTKEKEKEKKKRERKVDEEKANLLSWIQNGLYSAQKIECTRHNEQKLHFEYNGNSYTVTLTRHK